MVYFIRQTKDLKAWMVDSFKISLLIKIVQRVDSLSLIKIMVPEFYCTKKHAYCKNNTTINFKLLIINILK
ncbi:MAG: hypothetical protein RLZ47_1531 [Bacteroidota bacterium]|jgi:hypothetical protein